MIKNSAMPLPSTAKPLTVYDDHTTRSSLCGGKGEREKKRKSMITLFKNVNPFTWFSEFSHIEITLEEFAAAKNKKRP